ncbi:MAG: protein kinase [Bacteroidaceae bacterium]|nr:protein kinase [Bacteroidaceae bacterium]
MKPNDDAAYTLPIGTVLDKRYQIEHFITSGGFGNTYIARDLKFPKAHTRVALKEFFIKNANHRTPGTNEVVVTTPQFYQDFQRLREKFKEEAERLFALHHPNIVRVSDTFDAFGTSYYVMDYIEGLSLSKTIRQQQHPFSEADAVRYIREVFEALSVVHEQGIYHMDIKPGNIMLDAHGRAVLIDFGASKMVKPDGQTLSSTILYTEGYAPVEQMNSSLKNIGPWTDIYAMGATLYYLLTAQRPPLPIDILNEGFEQSMPLPGVSQQTRHAIYAMMEPSSNKRPQNVAQALALLQDQPTSSTGSPTPQEATTSPAPTPDDDSVIVSKEAVEANSILNDTVISADSRNTSQRPQPPTDNPFAPKPKKKNSRTWLYISGGAAAIGIIFIFIGMIIRGGSNPSATENTAETPVVTADSTVTEDNSSSNTIATETANIPNENETSATSEASAPSANRHGNTVNNGSNSNRTANTANTGSSRNNSSSRVSASNNTPNRSNSSSRTQYSSNTSSQNSSSNRPSTASVGTNSSGGRSMRLGGGSSGSSSVSSSSQTQSNGSVTTSTNSSGGRSMRLGGN